MATYIGIDPGASGGISAVCDGGGIVAARSMPSTEHDIWNFLADLPGNPATQVSAIIEAVHSFPGSGPKCRLCGKPKFQQGVASTFKFGTGYGGLRMACHGLDIPFAGVPPQKWQKEFGLVFPKSLGLTITEKKNRHKAKAQELFPYHKITHATADSLLLAEYGRRRQIVPVSSLPKGELDE